MPQTRPSVASISTLGRADRNDTFRCLCLLDLRCTGTCTPPDHTRHFPLGPFLLFSSGGARNYVGPNHKDFLLPPSLFGASVREPRAAFNSTHFTVRMAPVTGAEKAALDAFFKGKRGERALIEPVAEALRDYFAAKGTTLPELTTVRPVDPLKVEDFKEEWE